MTTIADAAVSVPVGLRRFDKITFAGQLAFVATYVVGLGGLYLHGLAIVGSHDKLVNTPVDPKGLVPFGDHLWNPVVWLQIPIVLTALLAIPVAGLLAISGTALATLTDLRQSRRTRWMLLGGSIACLVVLLIALTPFGTDLQSWILD